MKSLPVQQPIQPRQSDNRVVACINKTVPFTYCGCRLQFHLSHALFSSNDIDDGTRLLLKTVAARLDFTQLSQVLDMGCGVGVIGLSLKKKYPGLQVRFTDRDALALSFTRENALLNQIGEFEIAGELGLEKPAARYSLILSNLPAKAGQPVLEDFILRCLTALAPGGTCAVVVIDALAGAIRAGIAGRGGEIRFEESTRRHTVFHFSAGGTPAVSGDFLLPYIRGQYTFTCGDYRYRAKTVYNLPDFDTVGYQTTVMSKILGSEPVTGHCLVWNPQQGHLPLYLLQMMPRQNFEFTLAGRDLLQLYITAKNLAAAGMDDEKIHLRHTAFPEDLKNTFDLLFINPDIVPEVPWERQLADSLPALLAAGGRVVVGLKSSYRHRLLHNITGLRILREKKHKGFCGLLLKRKGDPAQATYVLE